MKISNQMYDVLKYLAQIVLPAGATLYFALSSIWGLPCGEQIVGTITAADAFLGALLGLSAVHYSNAERPEEPEATPESTKTPQISPK